MADLDEAQRQSVWHRRGERGGSADIGPVTIDGPVTTGGLTDAELAAHLPLAVTGAFWQAVQPVSGTVSVTGVATAANQTTELAALGAPMDAEATANGGIIGLLKRLRTLLNGGLPSALGAGGGLKVDGSGTALPVSGTVTATGPLTDTQLRATAVPVSGTVTASGPLTDTQLRATAVPVSGTVTASGPLTDTQLRATAVPVSNADIPDLTGTWGYKAGVSGTPTLPGGCRVLGIAAHGTSAASMTINAGNSIPIIALTGMSLGDIFGQLVAPTVVFTGTDAYVVSYLT